MKSRFVFVCCAVFVVFLHGCNGTKSLSLEDREKIQKISVSYQNVSLGNDDGKSILYISTPGSSVAGLGGTAGFAVYSATQGRSYEDAVWTELQKDGMAKKAVADSFDRQFCRSAFTCVPPGEEDARLNITISNLVITPKIGGNISAELVDKSTGKTIWSGGEHYSNDGRLMEYPYEAYANEPEKLREGISVLSEMVAGDLIKFLNGRPR